MRPGVGHSENSDNRCDQMVPAPRLLNLLLIGKVALPRQLRRQMENLAEFGQFGYKVARTQSAGWDRHIEEQDTQPSGATLH